MNSYFDGKSYFVGPICCRCQFFADYFCSRCEDCYPKACLCEHWNLIKPTDTCEYWAERKNADKIVDKESLPKTSDIEWDENFKCKETK